MTPTGCMSLEFYDKMKYAFVLGSLVHIMYPAMVARQGVTRCQCGWRVSAPPTGVEDSDAASNLAEVGADILAVEMTFLWEFDEVLIELNVAHAKVMRLVCKQQMWQPDGYMHTVVQLSGMAMEMQCLRGALRTEHGAM